MRNITTKEKLLDNAKIWEDKDKALYFYNRALEYCTTEKEKTEILEKIRLMTEVHEIADDITEISEFKDKLNEVMEEKTFKSYIEDYFKGDFIQDYIILDLAGSFKIRFNNENYDSIPFEIRIGLFKFICDDHHYDWKYIIEDLDRYLRYGVCGELNQVIFEICPKEFLETLL